MVRIAAIFFFTISSPSACAASVFGFDFMVLTSRMAVITIKINAPPKITMLAMMSAISQAAGIDALLASSMALEVATA